MNAKAILLIGQGDCSFLTAPQVIEKGKLIENEDLVLYISLLNSKSFIAVIFTVAKKMENTGMSSSWQIVQ